MKKASPVKTLVFLPLVIVLLLVGCAQPASPTSGTGATTPAPTTSTTLRFAQFLTKENPYAMADSWWASEVERRSGGKVKVEMFLGGALAAAPDILKAVKGGTADVGFVSTGYTQSDIPLTALAGVPGVTNKFDASSKAMSELFATYAPFAEQWKTQNVQVLYFYSAPPNILLTKKPVATMAQLQGMKVRVSAYVGEVFKELGAVPVAIAVGEIYESLQRGIVEGVSSISLDNALALRLEEQAKYLLDSGVGSYASIAVVMNANTWAKLPDDVKKIIADVSSETSKKHVDFVSEVDDSALKLFKAAGVQLVTLSPDEYQRWRGAAAKVQQGLIAGLEAKGQPAKEFFDRYVTLVKKHEPTSSYTTAFEKLGR